jgi:hypothetical protein
MFRWSQLLIAMIEAEPREYALVDRSLDIRGATLNHRYRLGTIADSRPVGFSFGMPLHCSRLGRYRCGPRETYQTVAICARTALTEKLAPWH